MIKHENYCNIEESIELLKEKNVKLKNIYKLKKNSNIIYIIIINK